MSGSGGGTAEERRRGAGGVVNWHTGNSEYSLCVREQRCGTLMMAVGSREGVLRCDARKRSMTNDRHALVTAIAMAPLPANADLNDQARSAELDSRKKSMLATTASRLVG